MLKDILVQIPTERPPRPVIDASVSLAAGFGAHLDALAAGYVSTGTAYAIEATSGTSVTAILELERQRAEQRSLAALEILAAEARNAGVACECYSIATAPADAAGAIGATARLYDLTILLQPASGRETFDNALPTEILFQVGGPVLFVPHVFRGSFRPRRIGICWDGSRLAARALRDARPFVAQADAVVAISINGTQTLPPEASGNELAKHMSRAGRPIRLVQLPASRAQIQPMILSLAADEGLDMLVMGGYGHSRLQEGLLGGVTRAMLEAMTVPTLMSH